MAVKIRLSRRGRKKLAIFDIIIADARSPRDGKIIEKIGTYNPNINPAQIILDETKALEWLMQGAQPTDTVRAILSYKGVLLRKHLQIGVNKKAITQEEADKKFNAWLKEKEAKINKKIEYVLDQVGLTGFEKRPVHTLSGGQKQRLTIACALISNRNFILLDEPTALLDQTSQLKVLQTIKNLTSEHKIPLSALWITHRYEELTYADAVAELKNGFLSSWQEPSKFQYN